MTATIQTSFLTFANPYAPAPSPSSSEVVMSWSSTQQTIDGFGATLNNFDWGSATLPFDDTLADEVFDPILGIGISLVRIGISPEADLAWCNPTDITKAAARGARVFGCPWTAPAGYKSNGSEINGGSLNVGSYGDWSDDLTNWVTLVQSTTGVLPIGVLMQNEPDFSAGYESMLMSGSEAAAFAKVLGPKLHAISAKLIVGSFSSWDNLHSTVSAIEADGAALAATDYYATNQYYGTPSVGGVRPLWETEVSILGGGFENNIANAIFWSKKIHVALVDGEVSAWLYWWLLGPYYPGDAPGDGDQQWLISPPYTKAKRFYGLGQWSKFVRPGWVRTAIAGGPSNTYCTSFKNTSTGAFAIVIINDSGSSQSFGLSINGAVPGTITPYRTSNTENIVGLTGLTPTGVRASVTVAANSITTFTGMAS